MRLTLLGRTLRDAPVRVQADNDVEISRIIVSRIPRNWIIDLPRALAQARLAHHHNVSRI